MSEHDDAERLACTRVGEAGHLLCGYCGAHDAPRFECGCVARAKDFFVVRCGATRANVTRCKTEARAHKLADLFDAAHDRCTQPHRIVRVRTYVVQSPVVRATPHPEDRPDAE